MNPDNTIAVITETIPIGMQFDKVYLSTFNMWREILSNTTKTLDISSFIGVYRMKWVRISAR